jgi:uncharacterized membrane protein YczE
MTTDFMTKYHSYIVAFVAALLVAAQAVFGITIPEWLYDLLGAAGLTSLRITVSQSTDASVGWKSYVAAAGLAACAAAQAYGIDVPPEVLAGLATFGGFGLASGVRRASS